MLVYVWLFAAAFCGTARTDAASGSAATAHEPQFDNREMWPAWVAKAEFSKERWDISRVLVWKETDGAKSRGLDPLDPANWLDNGRAATEPPDNTTDVVFPGSRDRYFVAGRQPFNVRHLTIEHGAQVRFQEADIYGNVWIKRGGSYFRAKGIFGGPMKDTFVRSDNEDVQFVPNMLVHNKPAGKSTEWLGKWKVGDEVNLYSGRLIVGPDSLFMPTDRRVNRIGHEAELVLMSGSAFHLRGNNYTDTDIRIQGRLLAGTPERPLTEDCIVGLSFKTRGGADLGKADATDVGLFLCPDGEMAVHSAEPEKARLVFKWHRRPPETKKFKDGEPEAIAALPHGISMFLAGGTAFDGVVFEDVLKGGIGMVDPRAHSQWKNVLFGKNFGGPDALFVKREMTPKESRKCGSEARGRWNPVQSYEQQDER